MSSSLTGSIVLVLVLSFLLVCTCRQPAGGTMRRRCWKYMKCALLVLGAYLCCWKGLMIWYCSRTLSLFSLLLVLASQLLYLFSNATSLWTTQKIPQKTMPFKALNKFLWPHKVFGDLHLRPAGLTNSQLVSRSPSCQCLVGFVEPCSSACHQLSLGGKIPFVWVFVYYGSREV